jgi:cytochrome P450
MSSTEGMSCPAGVNADRRKSAPLAATHAQPDAGALRVKNAELGRAVMRSAESVQAGAGAESLHFDNPEHAPVFFLDGQPHRRKRITIAKFLSPKAVTTRHREIMEHTTDDLLTAFRRKGEGRLEEISFELAVAVVSDILGLTNSNQAARAKRIERAVRTGTERRLEKGLARFFQPLRMMYFTSMFYLLDVRPAKKARLKVPQDDVISHLIGEKYSAKALLIECLTYGSAGMMTTREFIVMAAWYLFEQSELRARYLASEPQAQLMILMEILRLEPVAAMLHRRVNEPLTGPDGASLPAGGLYAIDIRAVNTDEKLVGECPFAVDPDRATRQKENGRYMSFGDGAHNCPGWQVALHESRIFLDRLFRIPGIRLQREPDMGWNPGVQGYELHNAIIVCDITPHNA